jgi:hypothetical protein
VRGSAPRVGSVGKATRGGRERKGAGAWGPARGEEEWAEPEGTGQFLIYSIKFQTSLNCFDQKVDLTSSKNSK